MGYTRFNDAALKQGVCGACLFDGRLLILVGDMVIYNMREKRPAYNLISNNCQNFALALLDHIKVGAHREFATAFAVYERAIGRGTVEDLFKDKAPEQLPEDSLEGEVPMPGITHANTVDVAAQVMEENTTKLDNHHSLFHIH